MTKVWGEVMYLNSRFHNVSGILELVTWAKDHMQSYFMTMYVIPHDLKPSPERSLAQDVFVISLGICGILVL